MSTGAVGRKLTAILNADVQGYSRLMGDDEAATVQMLTACRELMGGLVLRHGGRVVDFTGDNLLAEFASVVGAVRGAVEIQEELRARNAELPDHRRMQFGIGINLGDVIVEGERIYGDGVNVAARVQGLAEGGGIAISGTVYDQIENKLALRYESLGEHPVKNIAKPVRIYRIVLAPKPAPDPGRTLASTPAAARRRRLLWPALAASLLVVLAAAGLGLWYRSAHSPLPPLPGLELPDKLSIAVLPFVNLGAGPGHEHLGDAVTETIIATLSRVSGLFVIASTSVFTYKGKPVKVQEVSRELGVRYVLEGSVLRSADRVRVTAQLIDATTGHHLWAERYDRNLADVFAVLDDLAQRIVTAMEVRLTEGEQASIRRRTTTSVEAWQVYQDAAERGRVAYSREEIAEARRSYEQAVGLDPRFAAAWHGVATTVLMDAWYGWSASPAEDLARARQLAEKAIALDESFGEPYITLAMVHQLRREHDQAVAAIERGVSLQPNFAIIHAFRARILTFNGRPEEAIEAIRRAMRLAPRYPAYYVLILGTAYRAAGRYEEAIAAFRRWHELNPAGAVWAHAGIAICLLPLGREAEALAAAAEALKAQPSYTLDRWARLQPYRNPADLERDLADLRRLGFK